MAFNVMQCLSAFAIANTLLAISEADMLAKNPADVTE